MHMQVPRYLTSCYYIVTRLLYKQDAYYKGQLSYRTNLRSLNILLPANQIERRKHRLILQQWRIPRKVVRGLGFELRVFKVATPVIATIC